MAFVSHINGKAWGGYWKNKFNRLLAPYILIVLSVFVVDFLTKRHFILPYYWYIDFQFFWYSIFFLIALIPLLYTHRFVALLLSSVAVFVFSCITTSGLRAEQAITFFIGILISENAWTKIILSKKKVICALLVFGCFLLACKQIPMIRMYEGTWFWYLLQLCLKTSVALGIIGILYKLRRMFHNPFIHFLGMSSYEIYLIHQRIQTLAADGFIGAVCFTLITLAGAFLLHNLSQKIIVGIDRNKWFKAEDDS